MARSLEHKKYKPWRRGKSKTSQRSAKQQLRAQERLLAKLGSSSPTSSHDDDNAERRQALERRIAELREQVAEKQERDQQRKNAKESHGVRFLERQRLTRMERTTRKLYKNASSPDEKERYDNELKRIALDQVYVAHFPHDVRYLPLFRNGFRMVDVKKKLLKRAITRKRILQGLTGAEDAVKWISPEQYQRVPKEWTLELEKNTFSTPAAKDGVEETVQVEDDRFALSQNHASMVDAAEELESALEKEKVALDEEKDSSSDVSSSNESSSDDESDGEHDDDALAEHSRENAQSASSDSSDCSSISESESESSSNQEEEEEGPESTVTQTHNGKRKESFETEDAADEFDDFFTTTVDEADVFRQAKEDRPDYLQAKGDKSKGWATQRQRPGQYKKRQRRN